MSSIIEREQNLIRAMKEQDFQPFFEGDSDDAFDDIGRALDAFPNYLNTVVRMTTMQPIIYARYEGQEIRDRISDLDSRRKSAHEHAISSITMLNRICDAYGTERIADIDTTNRYEVADFVGQYCAEVYETGKSKDLKEVENIKTMDAIMELRADRTDEYPNDSKDRLAQLSARFGQDITAAANSFGTATRPSPSVSGPEL